MTNYIESDFDYIQEQYDTSYDKYVKKLIRIKTAKGKTKDGKQNANLQLQRR